MPIDFENSLRGSVDISGQPDPVRTPKTLRDDTRRRLNQSERRPKAQSGGGLAGALGGLKNKAGEIAGDIGGGLEGMAKSLEDQGIDLQPKRGDFNPIDWAKQDASTVWGFGRLGYRTLSGAYHDGIHNLYAGHDAKSQLLQSGLESAIEGAIPLLGAKEKAQEAVSQLGVLTGRQMRQQAQQEIGREREQATQDAPGAATELASMASPGTLPGKAAMVGVPLFEQLMSGNPDEEHSALAWAAVGSLLTFGHIPAPARKLLQSRFLGWSDVENAITDAMDKKTTAGRNAMQPGKALQATKDWIGEQLQRGGMPEFRKVIAKAADKPTVEAELGEHGEIRLKTAEAAAKRANLLRKLGVEDVEGLVQKAGEEGFSTKASKFIRDNWKTLGLPYDLLHRAPGEAALRDPRAALEEIADEGLSANVTSHLSSLNHYLAEIHSGLFAGAKDPATAVLRALAGHSRVLDLAHGDYIHSMVRSLEGWGINAENGKLLMKAAEGDHEVYKSLPPEARAVADGWSLLRAAMREQSAGTNYAKNFVANWVPRLDVATDRLGRGRPSTASILGREARKKRATAINLDPETGQLVLGQRYKTVQDANRSLEAARRALAGHLTNPEEALQSELANDPEAKAIRSLVGTNPEEATQRARQLAQDRLAPKEESFFAAVTRAAGYQAKAVGTAKALRELEQTVIRTKHPQGGNVLRHAVVAPKNQRDVEEMLKQGYERIDDPRFSGHLFDSNFAKDLNRYVAHVGARQANNPGWFNGLLGIERKLVSWIMFSPTIHAMNVAGRMGMLATMHPLSALKYMKDGKAILPHMVDEDSYQLRREAWQSGVLPMRQHKGWAESLMGTTQDALGDVEDPVRELDQTTKQGRLGSLLSTANRGYHAVNDYFWSGVHDFGVMAYHLEKEAAMRHGIDETRARLYAARRANSWMGMVAPEDTNPMVHDLSRLVFFAPNWWRTWAELAVPVYRRSGVIPDPKMLRHTVYQGGKTALAAMAFQKMTGNLLNYMATSSTPWAHDGHLQHDNQPGSQDKIEATGAWLNDLPGFSGIQPVTPKTGARRTIENPLARQTLAIETALGKQSGQPDYQWTDTADGLAKFVASRLSPALDSAAALGNIDLYGTLTQHQLRAVLQNEEPGRISPMSLLAGALYGLPGATEFMRNVQRNQDPNQQDPTVSILGTRIPRSMTDFVTDAKDAGVRTVISGLLGVNAPYATAQKTRGQPISDQDYQRVREVQQQYQSQMQQLSAEALSGQITPAKWHEQQRDLSRKHAAQMEALYKGAPEYVHGQDGLVNDWQALYDKSTAPDGTVDQSKLAELQSQFHHDHSPEEMQQLQAGLRKNESKYPMLGLYHKTLDAYDRWQEGWAAQHGYDVGQVRQESSEYNHLFGDGKAQRQYLREHRGLAAFENAKKREWNRSQPGMMYALFHGQNAAVMRYLRARHLTEAEFAEQEASAA